MQIISEYWLWIIGLNLVLMFSIKYIIGFFTKKKEQQGNIFTFRMINGFFIVLLALGHIFKNHQEVFYVMFMTLLTLYVSVLVYELISYFILIRSGTKVKIEDTESKRENHNTRILSLLSLIFISFATLVILIKIWGFDSALETTGFIGMFVLFISLTAPIWGPDLISGILLLNTKFINDGDTIYFDDKYYMVYKFGFFETVLMNIETNNRTFVKNSKLRSNAIQNKDKPASASGIRRPSTYTVGYRNDEDYETYFKKIEDAVAKIEEKFYEISKTNGYVNDKVHLDYNVTNPGNHGIDITLAYYLNDISGYKSTKKLREVFNKPKTNFHKTALIEFQKKGIYLDTPILINRVDNEIQKEQSNTSKYSA